jgi:hypothetical protein
MSRSLKQIHFFSLQVNWFFQPLIPLPVASFYFQLKPYILQLYDLSIQFTYQRILFPVSFTMFTLPARHISFYPSTFDAVKRAIVIICFLYVLLCSLKHMIRPSNLPFCATGQSAFFLSSCTSTPRIPFVFNSTRVWDILQLSTDLRTSFPTLFATFDSPTSSQSPLTVAFCLY